MKAIRPILALLGLVALSTLTLAAQPRVFSKTGKAKVAGRDVFVHVTVAVQPGQIPDRVANEAIRAQGGIPLTAEEFATTGLVWDQIVNGGGGSVEQYYRPADDPTGDGLNILKRTQATWTAVTGSAFAMSYVGNTGRCPSLVRECKGPQGFDGNNDVAWLPLNSPTTLAVTWSSSSIDEADVAMNTRQNWSFYDAESVLLHENGHVAGLDHSSDAAAVMYAYYQEQRRALAADDIAGIITLYPSSTPPSLCPNGSIDSGEDCDGPNLNGASCATLGFSGGQLSCSSTCSFDDSACTNNNPSCGSLGQAGDSCTLSSDCCSGACRGRPGARVCK